MKCFDLKVCQYKFLTDPFITSYPADIAKGFLSFHQFKFRLHFCKYSKENDSLI